MNPEQKINGTGYGIYFMVWAGLILLTGLTYTVAVLFHPDGWAAPIALAIAGTKSGLVMYHFMHLKSEKLLIFKIIIPLVIAVFLVFILLTFSDVAFRGVMR